MTRRVYVPRGYQPPITQHILDHPRCNVWAGMGLGKCVATLTAVKIQRLCGDPGPVLVLAPLRVARSTWPDEARKWAHLKDLQVEPILGTAAERATALRRKAGVFTINYENLAWLTEHLGEEWPFRMVVADESTRLKNLRLSYRVSTKGKKYLAGQGGVRAKALGRVAHTKVKRFVNLTGTPSPNGLSDLWGQNWFVDAGRSLGRTYDSFKQRWFTKSYDGYGMTPLPNAMQEIKAAMAPYTLTVRAEDHFDLREPIVNTLLVDLPVSARKLYREMERDMFMQLEGHAVEAFNAASRTIKCLQLANGAAYVDDKQTWKRVHDEKIEALKEVIEEASGAPVLVAYHFKSDLARILKALPFCRVLDASPRTLVDWNAGRIKCLLAHPASAGHGLNLQDGGNILVYFGHWWNLEERQQMLERIGPVRQMQAGHDRPVFVHNIIARDTIDELVLERIESKRDVQDILLDAKRARGL